MVRALIYICTRMVAISDVHFQVWLIQSTSMIKSYLLFFFHIDVQYVGIGHGTEMNAYKICFKNHIISMILCLYTFLQTVLRPSTEEESLHGCNLILKLLRLACLSTNRYCKLNCLKISKYPFPWAGQINTCTTTFSQTQPH